jgi:hypothetical protein
MPRKPDRVALSLFVPKPMDQRIHRAMLRSGSLNKSDVVREILELGLKELEQKEVKP